MTNGKVGRGFIFLWRLNQLLPDLFNFLFYYFFLCLFVCYFAVANEKQVLEIKYSLKK